MECGGPRVSDQQSAALRRECWRALDLFSVLGKSLPERNLWIPWAARRRRTQPPTGIIAFFFSTFFSIDFWKAFFRFLVIFEPPWGPPKSSKITKSRPWRPSFFRADALLAFLADF